MQPWGLNAPNLVTLPDLGLVEQRRLMDWSLREPLIRYSGLKYMP
jgi:hypothetical protein